MEGTMPEDKVVPIEENAFRVELTDDQRTIKALLQADEYNRNRIFALEQKVEIQARTIITMNGRIDEIFGSFASVTAQMHNGPTEPEPNDD
jgi:hypothetical protein